MKRSKMLTTGAVALMWTVAAATAQTGGGYDLTWSTIDGGGGTSTGGGFELSGTIGQPDAGPASGPMVGGDYALTGGFWPGFGPACTTFAIADFTEDCRVNEADFLIFVACVTGPDIFYDPNNLPPGCDLVPDMNGIIAADFDGDGDVDHDDYGAFQRCISGNAVATPGCENF
jgi:hypothetical protein